MTHNPSQPIKQSPKSQFRPPGYKQTEVGVIPEDWELKSCHDISNLITVGIVVRPAQYYTQRGVPALRSANIRENGIDLSEVVFISEKSNAILSKSQIQAGDVLTVRSGYPGTSAVVPSHLSGTNCIDILIIRPSNSVNSHYLCSWINSPFGKNQVLRNQGGLAQQHFNVGDLRNLMVALPTLAEQTAIAEALGDADALIAGLEALIAKKRAIKQGTMQQLLTGQVRLPGFAGDWEVKPLGGVIDKFVNGGTPSTQQPEFWTGDIPWITGADIIDQQVSEIRRYITQDAVRNSSTNVIEQGNLLLVSRTGVGKLAIAPFAVAISQDFTGLYVRQTQLVVEFLFFYFDYNSELLRTQNQGTSIQGITRDKLASIPIPVPTLPEQTAIAAVLADMDGEIAALEAKLAKARLLKQGMMQELLTGRIRLL